MFNIYIDADSLPKTHRAIVLKRIVKESIYIGECVFASDRELADVRDVREAHTASLRLPYKDKLDKSELRKIKTNISMVVVPVGANSADNYLVENSKTPGFAITHDVPLSNRLVEKGIADSKAGDTFQFMRQGYFCVDKDSTEEKLIFNRTVPLNSSWGK